MKRENLRVSWYKEKDCYGLRVQSGSVLIDCKDLAEIFSSTLGLYEVNPHVFDLKFLDDTKEKLGETNVQVLESLVDYCNRVGLASQNLKGE